MGKGVALDTAAARLSRPALLGCGQSGYLALGAPPMEPAGWVVALGHPCRPEQAIAHIRLRDRALGTSGAAHQFFTHQGRRYGHILDPRTGRPAHRLLSATVLAPTAAEADALSTACFVLGVEESRTLLARRPGLGAVLTRPKLNEPAALEIIRIGAVEMEVVR
jgi:thiamine biosynthesis lipoprotein